MIVNFRGAANGARDCKNSICSYAKLSLAVRRARAVILLVLFVVGLHASSASAQGLDPAALLKPATDTWPTYNGDYSGRRYSTLDQINAGNINSLTLAWAFPSHSTTIKSTPLEVNGVLYFS